MTETTVNVIMAIILILATILSYKMLKWTKKKNEEYFMNLVKKTVREELETKQKEEQEPRQVFHHLTQAEFEKWKAERDKREP